MNEIGKRRKELLSAGLMREVRTMGKAKPDYRKGKPAAGACDAVGRYLA